MIPVDFCGPGQSLPGVEKHELEAPHTKRIHAMRPRAEDSSRLSKKNQQLALRLF